VTGTPSAKAKGVVEDPTASEVAVALRQAWLKK
jgi:hypothetical protein